MPDTGDSAKPWGWKVTLHIYGSGERPSGAMISEAARVAGKELEADDVVGADLRIVREQPHGQVAS